MTLYDALNEFLKKKKSKNNNRCDCSNKSPDKKTLTLINILPDLRISLAIILKKKRKDLRISLAINLKKKRKEKKD